MKKLANDSSAVSEIVGALMLILIVVVAASSLAVFVAQQQKILQDNQLIKTEKEGESLMISSLKIDTNDIGIINLTIPISSLHQGSSQINHITINGHMLREYSVTRQELNGGYESTVQNYTTSLYLASQETISIKVNMSDFFDKVQLKNDSTISIKLFTALSNEFDKVFYSPTSIIGINVESQWNSSDQNYSPYLILDGSGSDQTGDSTIVRWNWSVDCNGISYTVHDGRKVRFDPPVSGTYNITLMVENVNGLIGISKTTYHH
jgi:flagellin-like protein